MNYDGYGYEYDATYMGGPADGLESSVVVLNTELPPRWRYMELSDCAVTKVPLGGHILKRSPGRGAKVNVYLLEGNPSDYDHEDDVLMYQFIETTTYEEYVRKFGEE